MPSTDFPFGYNLHDPATRENTTDDVFSVYKHFVQFCDHCQTNMIICGKCGNNCCNGGYGTLPDGTTCDVCPEAYELQAKMWAEQEPDDK